jgi:hypothetical protein
MTKRERESCVAVEMRAIDTFQELADLQVHVGIRKVILHSRTILNTTLCLPFGS